MFLARPGFYLNGQCIHKCESRPNGHRCNCSLHGPFDYHGHNNFNSGFSSSDTITVTLTNAAAAVFSLFKVKAVSANTTVELLTRPLVVAEAEIIKVTAATGGRLHVVASLLELS